MFWGRYISRCRQTAHSTPGLFVVLLVGVGALVCWSVRRLDWSAGSVLPAASDRAFLIFVILLGLILRYWIYAAYPVEQWSDARSYVRLAEIVLTEGRYYLYGDVPGDYYLDHSYANWPPGLVVWLVSFKAVLGEWPHQIFLGNAILFVVAMVGLWRLSENLASTASRRLVLILYALYPNFIYHCMFASKETLGAALLIWSMFLLFRPGEMSQRAWWGYLPAGLLIGYAALTQPALMLLPVVLLIYDGIVVRNRETIKRLLLVSLGFVVVLTPWSIRNYLVLDRVIPISTGSGYNFLSANSPESYGQKVNIARPEHLTPAQWRDELIRSDESWKIGKQWIRENPKAFARLVVLRQFYYMGEGARGANVLLKNQLELSGASYTRHYYLSQIYTLAMWVLALIVAVRASWCRARLDGISILWLGIFTYPLLVHSIMESSGRHQMIPIAFMLLLIGNVWGKSTRQREA